VQNTRRFDDLLSIHPGCSFLPDFLDDLPEGKVYLVGGAVRDLLLSRPCKDIDFVIAGVPRKKLEVWFKKRGRIDLVGSRFGVYKFLPRKTKVVPEAFIDIALPRTERVQAGSLGGYREFDIQADAWLPIESDLSRRDFTVNAMAYDVRARRLVDPFGGQRDVQRKLIRAVGEPSLRFHEDLSRMLRAIRIAAQLGFDIEPDTWRAIRQKIADVNLKRPVNGRQPEYVVPRETVGRELAKALSADTPKTLALLEKAGALSVLFPGAGKLFKGDYLDPLRVAPRALTSTIVLLLRGLPPQEAAAAMRACGLTSLRAGSPLRVDARDVSWMVGRLQQGIERPLSMKPSEFERVFQNARGEAYVQVLEALGQVDVVRDIRRRSTAFGRPERFVTGEDVTRLGLAPGPRVRAILDRVRDDQLEGLIDSRRRALDLMRELI